MVFEVKRLSCNDGIEIYNMLQEIPKEENGLQNKANGLTFYPFSMSGRAFCRIYHPISFSIYSFILKKAYNGILHTCVSESILSPTFLRDVLIAIFGR